MIYDYHNHSYERRL